MPIFKNHLFSSAWPNFAHMPSPEGRPDGPVATLYLQPPTSATPAQATFLQLSNHTSVPGKIQIGPSWGICSSWTHHCDQRNSLLCLAGLCHVTTSLIRSYYWQLTSHPLKEIRSRKKTLVARQKSEVEKNNMIARQCPWYHFPPQLSQVSSLPSWAGGGTAFSVWSFGVGQRWIWIQVLAFVCYRGLGHFLIPLSPWCSYIYAVNDAYSFYIHITAHLQMPTSPWPNAAVHPWTT